MKRTKRLILLTALLALGAAATFLLSRYEEKQEEIKASGEVILEIAPEQVTALSWEYESGTGFAFQKAEDGWIYAEDAAFPVSEERIGEILEKFESYAVTFTIDNVEDYAQYGLDEPSCTLHITTETGEITLKMGDFSKMDEQRYIAIGDGRVYLVAEDPMDYVPDSLTAMIRNDDTPSFETVEKIVLSGSESYTITYDASSANSYSAADVYFTERDGTAVPLNTASVKKLLNTVSTLRLTNYVTYNATAEELTAYGMDAPLLTLSVFYTETDDAGETQAKVCTIHIGEDTAERAEAEASGETDAEVTKYVRVGDSAIIYPLSSADYAVLKAVGYNDLRHKEVFWGDAAQLTQIDVELEGEKHSLLCRTEGEDDAAERVWYLGEREVELSAVQTALENLSADSFTDSAPEGKLEIGLTLYLTDTTELTIALYRYDGTNCIAVIDGVPVSLISRAAVVELIEAVQKLLLA